MLCKRCQPQLGTKPFGPATPMRLRIRRFGIAMQLGWRTGKAATVFAAILIRLVQLIRREKGDAD